MDAKAKAKIASDTSDLSEYDVMSCINKKQKIARDTHGHSSIRKRKENISGPSMLQYSLNSGSEASKYTFKIVLNCCTVFFLHK